MPIPEVNPPKVWKALVDHVSRKIQHGRTFAGSTYSKNFSCDTPFWFSCVLGFPENKAENSRSKLIRSCAYFRRSNSYCTWFSAKVVDIKLKNVSRV